MPPAPPPKLFDAELIATLDRAFATHAGADSVIDAVELQRAIGLRSEYLAQRMLAAFDRDRDGVIRRDEFLEGVRRLVFGSDREKLAFAFEVHDADGDGLLVLDEVHRMIATSLVDSDIAERASQPPWALARVFFERADKNRDGRITFEEFEATLRERPELITRMVRTEALWIAPDADLVPEYATPRVARRHRLARFLQNRLPAFSVVLGFALVNALVLTSTLALADAEEHPLVVIGRALGWCLAMDVGVVLVPTMRRLLTWVRSSVIGRFLPIDESIDFHRLVGNVLVVLAVLHAGGFVAAYAVGHEVSDARALFTLVFGTFRGATGAIALGLLIVLWAFAQAPIRRSRHFELFHLTHLLYAPFLVLVAVHAPWFLAVAGVPLLAHLVEIARRGFSRGARTWVAEAEPLASGVTRLRIVPPTGFTFSPGDYVFLRIPAIARSEWHPFTLSSAPGRHHLEVHVRSLGNWTEELRRVAAARVASNDTRPLEVFVDGPYGTPSAHIFESEHAVFIGAGIGVTPFAAVLDDLLARADSGRGTNLRKVHFFWLNRDQTSFEWFVALLHELEKRDARKLIEFHLCMTRGRSGVTALALEASRSLLHTSGRTDLVTGLRSHTHFGHPDWNAMLGQIALQSRARRVDVFFCGPAGLAKKLRPLCEKLGMSFREEQF